MTMSSPGRSQHLFAAGAFAVLLAAGLVAAIASLDAPNDTAKVGEWIRKFLTETKQ